VARKLTIKSILVVPHSVQLDCNTRFLHTAQQDLPTEELQREVSTKIYSHQPPAEVIPHPKLNDYFVVSMTIT